MIIIFQNFLKFFITPERSFDRFNEYINVKQLNSVFLEDLTDEEINQILE